MKLKTRNQQRKSANWFFEKVNKVDKLTRVIKKTHKLPILEMKEEILQLIPWKIK